MANSGIYHIVEVVPVPRSKYEDQGHHALSSGTSFPSSPVEKQLFYRTDLHKLYIYDGTNWIDTSYASADANAAIATHAALTTGVHGLDGRRNVIINGGFTINQRAYASAAALAAGSYGHDRWKAGAGGGDYSFTQLASPTTITIAANKTLIQVVENKNVYGGTYVLSWIGTCQARYGLNSATPSGSYASSPIIISGQTAGTTMSVEFGNGASSGTLGLVQLELGSVATPFEFRPYKQELGLCKRYFVSYGGSSFQVIGVGIAASASKVCVTFPASVRMRVTPSVGYSAAGDWKPYDGAAGFQAFTNIGTDSNQISPDTLFVIGDGSIGLTVAHPYFFSANGTTAARLTFNAEL
jgi:hypothetical protein